MSLSLSASKRVTCGDLFLDLYGKRPSGRIQLLGKDAPGAFSSRVTSWSAFPSRGVAKKRKEAGEHVAVAFNQAKGEASGTVFFHVAIFRCDTWAVRWVTRASSVGGGGRVFDVCCLDADNVAFLVECESGDGANTELCVATRFDIPPSTKVNGTKWRSFISEARVVDTGFGAEGIRGIGALSPVSLLVLTGNGRLVRVSVSYSREVTITCEQVALLETTIQRTRSTHDTSALVVSRNYAGDNIKGKDQTYAAVLRDDGSKCYVLDLSAPFTEGKLQRLSFPRGSVAERIEFAGPYMLTATLRLRDVSLLVLHFTCLFPQEPPSEVSFTVTSFDPIHLPARRVPMATLYDFERETHVVVSRWSGTAEDHYKCDHMELDGWWRRLEFTEMSLSSGPYTTEALREATWLPLPEPFQSSVPALGAVAGTNPENDDIEAFEAGYHQEFLLLNNERPSVSWARLRLHYALAALRATPEDGTGKAEVTPVTVFAVETAPYLHSRLTKQWHNAVQGLSFLLGKVLAIGEVDGEEQHVVQGLPVFAVPWNPQHVRRALRLFGQSALCQLFSLLARVLRFSAEPATAKRLFYGAATTSVVDVAMQIITLSQKVGSQLRTEDVETVVLLLRASRELGHAIVNHTTRSQLLLECVVKSRMADRVLGGIHGHLRSGSDGAGGTTDGVEGEGKEVIGSLIGAGEMHVDRVLHNRYATNDWSQRLLLRRDEHADIVGRARLYLNEVLPLVQHIHMQQAHEGQERQEHLEGENEGEGENREENGEKVATDVLLPDWAFMGRRPHAGTSFTEYEGVLLRTGIAPQ